MVKYSNKGIEMTRKQSLRDVRGKSAEQEIRQVAAWLPKQAAPSFCFIYSQSGSRRYAGLFIGESLKLVPLEGQYHVSREQELICENTTRSRSTSIVGF